MKNRMLLALLFCFSLFDLNAQDFNQRPYKKTDLGLLHTYIDSVVQAEMTAIHVPGAIVVIVQDSSEVYQKAYGYADVASQHLVDIDQTGFRIASVTKTFTATAILQLAQRGLIDLHTPISNYLPDEHFTFLKDEPITAHHLLTHTAGIDFTDISDAAVKSEDVVLLEEMVRQHIPDQVHSPGEVHSYSNFGYTILGYLIQHISGIPYEEYIRQNILLPLDMTHSSMSQPLEEPFKSNLSKSYKWDEAFVNLPRDYTNTVPGGGLISSATDMSKYLLMHLNRGTLDSTEILNKASHGLLTSQQYGSLNTKYGVCYSFFENGWTGRRSIDHTGGQLGFLSLFLLIPETGTGVFIAHNNREDASAFRYNVTRALLDTLLYRKERHIELPGPSDRLDELSKNYTGRYQQMNHPHSSFEKLGTLFGFFNSAYVVRYKGDGVLQLNGAEYVMKNERLFHINEEDSPWNIEFVLDENGKAQKIIAGTTSYNRTPWYHSKKVWQRLMASALLLTLINLLKRPVYWLIGKIRKRRITQKTKNPNAGWLTWTGLFLVLGLIGILSNLLVYGGQLSDYGVPLSFKIPLVLTSTGSALSLYSPMAFYRNFTSKLNRYGKIWNSFLISAVIIIAIGYWYFNIVGFNF